MRWRVVACATLVAVAACTGASAPGVWAEPASHREPAFTRRALWEAMPPGTIWHFRETTPDGHVEEVWEVLERRSQAVRVRVRRGGEVVRDEWDLLGSIAARTRPGPTAEEMVDDWHEMGWATLWGRRTRLRERQPDGVLREEEIFHAHGYPGPPLERVVWEDGVEVMRRRRVPPPPRFAEVDVPAALADHLLPPPHDPQSLLDRCGAGERVWTLTSGLEPAGGWPLRGERVDFRSPRNNRVRWREHHADSGEPVDHSGRRGRHRDLPEDMRAFDPEVTTRTRMRMSTPWGEQPGWWYRTLTNQTLGPRDVDARSSLYTYEGVFFADAFPCWPLFEEVVMEDTLKHATRAVPGPPMAMTWEPKVTVATPMFGALP